MAIVVKNGDSVVADPETQPLIAQLDHLIGSTQPSQARFQLVATFHGTDGAITIDLPDALVAMLGELAHGLAGGAAVSIVPNERELTTQEAAEFLNVSRQYFVGLLDRGVLPHHRVGSHRRVAFGDVLRYRRKRDAERLATLDDMDILSQESSAY